MLFHSQAFVVGFLPAVLVLFYAVGHRRRVREALLVAASILFYAWWNPLYVPLLVGLALATWGIARAYLAATERAPDARWPAALLVGGMALNLGALAIFKYADFFGSSFAWLLDRPYAPFGLVLPLGISFFAFQKLSYLIDLRRGDRHGYGLLDFSLFVSFFPQLIAGPLVRHNEIIGQFADDPRGPRMWENLSRGGVLFVTGMAKKLAIADTIAPDVDALFAVAAHATPNAAQAWAAAAGYALQIYFDFSGYTDMAIGAAMMFGLRLPMNFDAPYRAVSVRDFWRRWHITLSRFLRDYVYIPLGGSRRGETRRIVNVIATMLIGGLWHGAAWKFVFWGGLHGVGLAVNGAWDRLRLPRVPRPVGWFLTLVFVVAAWVPFRAEDFPSAFRMFAGMAGINGLGTASLRAGWLLPVGAAAAMIGPTSTGFALGRLRPSAWFAVPAGVAFAALVFLSGGRLHDVFIYFQF